MPMPVVVPDVSVILKWVLPSEDEPELEKAIELRDAIVTGDVHAVVPTLWLYEVGNILARRFPGRAQYVLDVLLRFDLVRAPRTAKWLNQALELTVSYGVTFYDAAYHAHAILQRGVFVTADERYVINAGEAGCVVRLGDWAADVA